MAKDCCQKAAGWNIRYGIDMAILYIISLLQITQTTLPGLGLACQNYWPHIWQRSLLQSV